MSEKVRLPRSSYEELSKIIRAYGQIDQPATLNEICSTSAMARSVVSGNNAFLTYVNIIEGGNKKSATPLGRKLAHALEHQIEEKISKNWREIIENNEFLNKMALAVKIRRGMEISALLAHIAYNAGEKKSGPVMTGARAVLDILSESGLIKEEDGKLIPVVQPEKKGGETPFDPGLPPGDSISDKNRIRFSAMTKKDISVNIEVQIQAKPSDLDDLGLKLKNFLKQLSESQEDIDPSDDIDPSEEFQEDNDV